MSAVTPLKIAVIVGSTRAGRFGPALADWVVERMARHGGLEPDLLDLAHFDLPTVIDFGAPEPPAVGELGRRLADADGFLVVTPEYNHSFPASLKNAIDLYRSEWNAKPVSFVSYGGISGGLRAVEQLRLVFAELHATTLRDTVSLHGTTDLGPDPGREAAAKVLFDQLTWWAQALRDARTARPYAS
ncbi:NAD(P)H-dependent oxidoreductase [Streptomyces sp. ACA25]|uniref:NADPH-dependent FMN reductase n=1 Tax=Streptomyces sp. ACA25 TaxID=3022596 RepID=UPI00230801BB|nr:NAD(P)H-dependent oxidoreductase [Streptomyces sp. ACA25]MDB1087986.1 NAD(P)H-dependent oxidoreductase [Streptomyces sp. ACA25]